MPANRLLAHLVALSSDSLTDRRSRPRRVAHHRFERSQLFGLLGKSIDEHLDAAWHPGAASCGLGETF